MSLDLPRQRKPVEVVLFGDIEDVQHYRQIMASFIDNRSLDVVTYPTRYSFTIHPRANND